jgi:hypothetical protein
LILFLAHDADDLPPAISAAGTFLKRSKPGWKIAA